MPSSNFRGKEPAATLFAISVVIPVFNGAAHLSQCLAALRQSACCPECIVVDDCSTDRSSAIAREAGATVLHTGKRKGPAFARNMGTAAAKSDLLFFIDSDVCVRPDTVSRVVAAFEADPQLDALIGSYDDSPERQDFISQYRNLLHHYVHQQSRRDACTFWSGCGAIRRACFLETGGFDDRFDRPAIEDIEFGYRLRRAQRKIVLDHDLQVKHLKEWSFAGLIKTDILDRGIPWTELILRYSTFPNDLNLSIGQRISVALVFTLVGLGLFLGIREGRQFLLPVTAIVFLLLVRYQGEIIRKKRWKGAIVVVLLIATVALNSWLSSRTAILISCLLPLGMVLLGQLFSPITETRRYTAVMRVSAFCVVVAILFNVTQLHLSPFLTLFVIALVTLILLNARFYILFSVKRGRMFALSAMLFHFLFHFYSGISFIAGLTHFSTQRLGRRFSRKPPQPVDRPERAHRNKSY